VRHDEGIRLAREAKVAANARGARARVTATT
jgi:hypothetical protein